MRTEHDPKGEDASAAVEFAVLIPVYLLLVVALITVGSAVMVRQQVILGTRYCAWLRGTGEFKAQPVAAVSRTLFKPFEGQSPTKFKCSPLAAGSGFPGDMKPMYFDQGDIDAATKGSATGSDSPRDRVKDPDGSTKGMDEKTAQGLAVAVLNDQSAENPNGPHLQWSGMQGSFQYAPSWMPKFIPGATSATAKANTIVLFRRENVERKTYKVGDDRHPIEDFKYGNAFPISTDEKTRFYSPGAPDPNHPYEQGYSLQPGPIPDTGSGDPGLWDVRYRLGGSVQAEWQFYKQMLGY